MASSLLNKIRVWISRPLKQKFISLMARGSEPCFKAIERFHGLDFSNDSDKDFIGRVNHPYEHGSIFYLKLFISESQQFGSFDCFVDIGCGKGRMLIVAAKAKSFGRIIGVDYLSKLIDVAKSNILKSSYLITLDQADAMDYFLPNSRCLVYLFNPFGERVMRRFITNNFEHFREFNSIMIYHNDVFREVLINLGFQRKASEFGFQTGFYWLKDV